LKKIAGRILLEVIKEFDKYVEITGFKNAHIKNIDQFLYQVNKRKPSDAEIQFFDGEAIATWQHLYFAALEALVAFQNGKNLSKSVAMESMLYASAQTQIKIATKTIGIMPSTRNVSVLIISDAKKSVRKTLQLTSKMLEAKPDDSVQELTTRKERVIRMRFRISRTELETTKRKSATGNAMVDLVIERMALLANRS
jgi:tRNA threonylcarbamoyladenosine modification (KEOPS) complex Cgi121 subunit